MTMSPTYISKDKSNRFIENKTFAQRYYQYLSIQKKCEVETGFSACNRTTWRRSALSECF